MTKILAVCRLLFALVVIPVAIVTTYTTPAVAEVLGVVSAPYGGVGGVVFWDDEVSQPHFRVAADWQAPAISLLVCHR